MAARGVQRDFAGFGDRRRYPLISVAISGFVCAGDRPVARAAPSWRRKAWRICAAWRPGAMRN